MVVLDLEKRIKIVVLRNPVVGRLKRERKQSSAFILHREIDGTFSDFTIGR